MLCMVYLYILYNYTSNNTYVYVYMSVCMYVCIYVCVCNMYIICACRNVCVYLCTYVSYVYAQRLSFNLFCLIIYIYFFSIFSVSFIFCSTCVYLCTETSSLTYFVYKLNCYPSLCHTLGVVTVYECVLCLNYVLLNVCLHLFTSTSTIHLCK